jgi:hypothetical protein
MHQRPIIARRGRTSTTAIAALVAVLPAVAGCGANFTSGSTLASNENGGYPDRLLVGPGGLFNDNAPATTASLPSPEANCPVVNVRDGAGTISVVDGGPKAPGRPRYEGSIGSTLRECSTVGATMQMKVAVHGHLVVRSAGRGGQVEIPMRYTIVQQGPEPKTIVSKVVRVPVAITRERTSIEFSSVADDLVIPLAGAPPGAFAVYVGFEAPDEPPPTKRMSANPRPAT